MITFVEYLNMTKDFNFVKPCGSDSIVILDGRKKIKNLKKDAIACNGNRRPKFDAFQIFKGETVSRNIRPITKIQLL